MENSFFILESEFLNFLFSDDIFLLSSNLDYFIVSDKFIGLKIMDRGKLRNCLFFFGEWIFVCGCGILICIFVKRMFKVMNDDLISK